MYTHLRTFVLFVAGGHNKQHKRAHLTGRAGGARADDNFTKKPQKKLIRYMTFFWGFTPTCALFRKLWVKIFKKSGNFPN